MKASEFIRVFGLDIARMAVGECPSEYGLDTVELKRIVNSHELVKKHNGLESAKHDLYTAKKVGMYIVWGASIDLLKQAIADVESCQ